MRVEKKLCLAGNCLAINFEFSNVFKFCFLKKDTNSFVNLLVRD